MKKKSAIAVNDFQLADRRKLGIEFALRAHVTGTNIFDDNGFVTALFEGDIHHKVWGEGGVSHRNRWRQGRWCRDQGCRPIVDIGHKGCSIDVMGIVRDVFWRIIIIDVLGIAIIPAAAIVIIFVPG